MAARHENPPPLPLPDPRENTRDNSDRFRGDTMLRQYGFAIESRPGTAPAVWRRLADGKLFTDHDARVAVMAVRAKELKKLERR